MVVQDGFTGWFYSDYCAVMWQSNRSKDKGVVKAFQQGRWQSIHFFIDPTFKWHSNYTLDIGGGGAAVNNVCSESYRNLLTSHFNLRLMAQ